MRMKRGQKVTNKQCELAIVKFGGRIKDASEALGITYNGLNQRIKREPELEKILIKVRETLVDTAEAQLLAHLERGEWEAIKFVLKTLGKNRGYTEKTEVEHKGDMHLHFDRQDKEL